MSYIEQEDPVQHDTNLMPVLFRDGADRRQSARIPVFGPVRMGPPSGEPYAVVSATNLSRGGLFIDADRAVRVGARFSAEIPLRTGGTIYVAEAEVAYNREHATGSGFGVRFIDPPVELIEKIDREIADVEAPSARGSIVEPRAGAPEPETEGETLKTEIVELDDRGKRAAPAIDVDITHLPEPMIPDDLGYESQVMEPAPLHATKPPAKKRLKTVWEDLMHRAKEVRRDMIESARHFPVLWISAGLLGMVTVLGAGGLAFHQGLDKEVVEPAPTARDRGVSTTTQQALMGERQVPAMLSSLARADMTQGVVDLETRKPLPPLVLIDDAQKAVDKMIRIETDEVPPQSKGRAARSLKGTTPEEKDAERMKSPKSEAKKQERQRVAEKPAKKAEEIAKKAIERATELSERAKAMLTSSIKTPKAPKAPKISKLKIDLGSAKAQVLKTHVFTAPNRFVIDVSGLDKAPAMPAPSGHMKQVRFGKHPDFARIVIETDAPIERGRVAKSAQNLSVTIDYQE